MRSYRVVTPIAPSKCFWPVMNVFPSNNISRDGIAGTGSLTPKDNIVTGSPNVFINGKLEQLGGWQR